MDSKIELMPGLGFACEQTSLIASGLPVDRAEARVKADTAGAEQRTDRDALTAITGT
jgi:hypothetical protein